MKTLTPYRHAIGAEARAMALLQRGDYTLEEAEDKVSAIQAARTAQDQYIIDSFYAEAKRTVFYAERAGLLPKRKFHKDHTPLSAMTSL